MSHVSMNHGRPPINMGDAFTIAYEVGLAEQTRQRYILQSARTVDGAAAALPSAEEANLHFKKESP